MDQMFWWSRNKSSSSSSGLPSSSSSSGRRRGGADPSMDPSSHVGGGSGSGSRRRIRRLDRRNAVRVKRIELWPSRSLDLAPDVDLRISCGSVEGEVDKLCHSLGLSGPEDFAVPVAAWEARKSLLGWSPPGKQNLQASISAPGVQNRTPGRAPVSRQVWPVKNSDTQAYMELNILERIVNGSDKPSPLDFTLLHSITGNFSEKNKIGSGGCGSVYKGILRSGAVAVKKLHNTRTIKDKMFHREVKSLFLVKHPNIVRFLGYCSFTKEHAMPLEGRIIMVEIRERLLCFEYIRNGSLDQHLSDELRGLEWQTRYQIIIGICRGLHYLHKDKEIIHMDLKPGNILLDDLMVPKITDFGLSRPESDSLATTTRLISQGYTAPEYISGGKATSKSDIYSLGVIIIELVTGSRLEPNITKVMRRWNHRWTKSMKQSLLAYQQVNKCLKLALRCIQDVPTSRPDISDITHELKEIDSTDSQTQIQVSSCWLEDILGIEPREICVAFEDFKISRSIELTNDTDDYIAFVTNAKLERFCTKPNRGIVPPRSKRSVIVAMQAPVNAQPKVHYTEVITVQSTRVVGALSVDTMDVTSREIFVDKEGKVVDEVNVMVVFGTPQLREE